MATELFIKPYGEASYSQVDLEAGIPLPYTFSILDIRAPEKRNSNWSKELLIPGTKANNILFKFIFEIGAYDSFNPNKKAEVYVLQDSLTVIPYAILQLLSIKRDKQNLDRIYYEVAISGGIEDIWTALGESDLTALDLSEWDHDYTAAEQQASWSATPGTGYVYPMIDYSGRNRAVAASNFDAWNVDEFLPAVFVKEYWDKMFAYAGKTYTSASLETDLFKRLLIPFNKEKYLYSNAEIIAREFRAESPAPTTGAICYPTHLDAKAELSNDSAGTAYDPSNIFNTTTWEYTVPAGKAGYYSLEAFGELGFIFNGTGTITATTTLGYVMISAGLAILIYNSAGVFKQGAAASNIPAINNGDTFTPGIVYFEEGISVKIERIYLAVGDKVSLNVITKGYTNVSFSGSTTVNPNLKQGAYLQNFLINELTEDATVNLNSCIPAGIKMRDFFKSIIQAFHLYIDVDKDNVNNYIIEPRDDWYTSEVVDWSAKLDYEKGLEIIPMAELQGKEYLFRYKTDKDFYNEEYQKKYIYKDKPRTYGDKIIEVDNDFVKSEVVNELIFSATPSFGNDSNTRVIPAMFFVNSDKPEQKATNIRLLYWGGLKNYTGRPWVHYSKVPGTYTAHVTQYPYAGHLDDPFTPTLDLSFGMPSEVNWNIRRKNYTSGNLYNKYHKRFTEEITDPNSRMVTGYFLLTPLDIFNLSFRKLYYFHKDLYRLHKVNDYDLDEYRLIKCEFLKVKDPGVYSVASLPVFGGIDDTYQGNKLPDVALPKKQFNGNIQGIGDAVVTGSNNIIAKNAAGVVVIGNSNSIWDNARNVFIQGSNNVVYPNIENVTLIQTNDVTVTDSNTMYINGCLVSGCVAVTGGGGGG